jgi:tetratricopeptide (TPR) repeat protein
MPKTEMNKKSLLSFDKEFLVLLAGFISLVLFAYGVLKTFLEVQEGLIWLVPVGGLLWLAILWRLVLSRRLYSYILLGITLISLPVGWFVWQRQDQIRANSYTVIFSKFDMSEDPYGVRDQLVQQLKETTNAFGDVQIISSDEMVITADGDQSANQIGTKLQADLLVWGFYRSLVNPNVSIKMVDFSSSIVSTPKKTEIFSHREIISSFDTMVITRKIETKTNTASLFLAGVIRAKRADYASSLNYFDQVVAAKDSSTAIPIYDIDFFRAYDLAGLGKTNLAVEAYNKAVLGYRKGTESYNNRGVIYAGQGNTDLAIQNYTTAIQINKNYVAAYNNRGNMYVDTKQFEKAIPDFNKAVGIDPNFSIGFYNRGNAFYTMGQYDAAISDYTKAIALDPNNSFAYFNRGTSYQKLGKSAEAGTDFSKYTSLTGIKP